MQIAEILFSYYIKFPGALQAGFRHVREIPIYRSVYRTGNVGTGLLDCPKKPLTATDIRTVEDAGPYELRYTNKSLNWNLEIHKNVYYFCFTYVIMYKIMS